MKGSNLPTVTSSGLRSRKVDFKKGLSVYRHGDLDDFDEVANVARIAQNINTGVEKEEEEEHHLQVALNSNYIGNQHNSAVFIPTPDATRKYTEFTRYYAADFYPPTSYIKFSDQLEDCIGCPYNMDEKDDLFYYKLKESNSKKPRPLLDTSKSTDNLTQSELNNSIKFGDSIDVNSLTFIENLSENQFEQIMWTMEKAANDKVSGDCPSLEDIYSFCEISDRSALQMKEAFPFIYEHWKQRRFTEQRGNMINPVLKTEDIGLNTDSDPYICFRKREIKTLRKRGRADTHSLDKLKKLRAEMYRAREILELVLQRETLRLDSLTKEREIFDQRVAVRRMKKKLGITHDREGDSPDRSKRRLKDLTATRIRIPLHKLKDAMTDSDYRIHLESVLSPFMEMVAANERAAQKKSADQRQGWYDMTDENYQPYYATHEWSNYWSKALSGDDLMAKDDGTNVKIVSGRKRIGRNGRLYLDQNSSNEYHLTGILSSTHHLAKEPDRLQSVTDLTYIDSDDSSCITPLPIVENAINFAWRAFNLCATTDIECRNLITKPFFPEQNNPQPSTLGAKVKDAVPLPQVSRQSLSSTTGTVSQKKKTIKVLDQAKVIAALNKKKQAEALDPRAATIKAMMQQAQRQAQQTQIQIQQQLHSGNHITAHQSSNIQTSNHAGAALDLPSTITAIPSNDATEQGQGISLDPVVPVSTNNVSKIPQQQARPRMMQPFRMQPSGMTLPPSMTNLTSQQLQQLYYSAAQQQQQIMMSVASQQAQQAIHGRVRMGMNPGILPNSNSTAQAIHMQQFGVPSSDTVAVTTQSQSSNSKKP